MFEVWCGGVKQSKTGGCFVQRAIKCASLQVNYEAFDFLWQYANQLCWRGAFIVLSLANVALQHVLTYSICLHKARPCQKLQCHTGFSEWALKCLILDKYDKVCEANELKFFFFNWQRWIIFHFTYISMECMYNYGYILCALAHLIKRALYTTLICMQLIKEEAHSLPFCDFQNELPLSSHHQPFSHEDPPQG